MEQYVEYLKAEFRLHSFSTEGLQEALQIAKGRLTTDLGAFLAVRGIMREMFADAEAVPQTYACMKELNKSEIRAIKAALKKKK